MEEIIEYFDLILSKKNTKAVCRRCGKIQPHSLVYCSDCGARYEYVPKTYYDVIVASYNGTGINRLTPSYIAAIHRRGIRRKFNEDYSEQFKLYLTNRLKSDKVI